ncbi:MAG: FHA domain-containing protein [Pseudomonadota bacterium]
MGEDGDTGQFDSAGVNSDPLFALPRYRRALLDVVSAYDNAAGVTVLTGAEGSGRRRLLRCLAARLQPHAATAFVSATEPRESLLLSSVFGQFGYDFTSQVLSELTGMLRVFSIHQADLGYRPLIGVLDADSCSRALIGILTELTTITSARKPAVHLVLTGQNGLRERLSCDDCNDIASAISSRIALEPLNEGELSCYLDARYGLGDTDPREVQRLLESSAGAVETIDAIMQNQATSETLRPAATGDAVPYETNAATDQPTLLLSQNGELIDTIEMRQQRFLIGRADHNDIALDSRYISRHHALIVAGPCDAHWLVDLNSRNGSFVNSRAIDYIALRHDDVIILGNHRVKYQNVAATGPRPARSEFAGNATAVFQTLPEDATKSAQSTATKSIKNNK